MKNEPWTAGAVDLLRELAPTGVGAQHIAIKLGRTYWGVTKKAEKLGILIAPPAVRRSPPTGDWYWKSIIGQMKERVRADVQRIMAS